jgi:hypothetical protein
MKGNLKEMKFWTCNFILMHYWIEIIVLCYLKGGELTNNMLQNISNIEIRH